jgi:hypothetical protein
MSGITPIGTSIEIESTPFGDITDVSYSPGSLDIYDTTTLSDLLSKTAIPGQMGLGSLSCSFTWSNASYAALLAASDGSIKVVKIIFSDGSTWGGSGALDLPAVGVATGSAVSGTFTVHQLGSWDLTTL